MVHPTLRALVSIASPALGAAWNNSTGQLHLAYSVRTTATTIWGGRAASPVSLSRRASYRVGEGHEKEPEEVSSELAGRYLQKFKEPFSAEAVRETAIIGNQLLIAVGSVKGAAGSVNQARLKNEGQHVKAARGGKLRGISEEHARYLRECVENGAPSRAPSVPKREKAKNHGSVRRYEQEMLQKAWKDAYYGAVFLRKFHLKGCLKLKGS